MNKIFLVGNLGADPVVKTFDNGGKVANFNVGDTERGYKTQSGVEVPEHTEWFRCVVKQSGEKGMCNVVEQYLKKGHKVSVVGKIRTRDYEDKGEKKSIKELIVEDIELLTPKNQSSNPTQQSTQSNRPVQPTQQDQKDDLPF